MTINNSSDVLCFDLAKSTKLEKCTDVMFKLTISCLSVTVEDIKLQQIYKYKIINILSDCDKTQTHNHLVHKHSTI